jgi:hypothetical protein
MSPDRMHGTLIVLKNQLQSAVGGPNPDRTPHVNPSMAQPSVVAKDDPSTRPFANYPYLTHPKWK